MLPFIFSRLHGVRFVSTYTLHLCIKYSDMNMNTFHLFLSALYRKFDDILRCAANVCHVINFIIVHHTFLFAVFGVVIRFYARFAIFVQRILFFTLSALKSKREKFSAEIVHPINSAVCFYFYFYALYQLIKYSSTHASFSFHLCLIRSFFLFLDVIFAFFIKINLLRKSERERN